MKFCFFSDIHGNGYAFDVFLKEMEEKKPDRIIFGGDFAGYYYDGDRIISKMRELHFQCILGNHDKLLLELLEQKRTLKQLVPHYGNSYKLLSESISRENEAFLRKLPEHLVLEEDGLRLGFFHGSPREFLNDRIYPDTEITDKEELALFEQYDYVFCGHTHHKLVKRFGETLLINPGSAGQQRDGEGTSYVLFDTKAQKWELVSFGYDRESLAADIDRIDGEDAERSRRLKEVLYRKSVKHEKERKDT